MIGIEHYITVSAILFVLGVMGIFINRKNVIVILMSVELILLAVNINLVGFSAFMNDLVGQIFAMFVLTVAAASCSSRPPLKKKRKEKKNATPLTLPARTRVPSVSADAARRGAQQRAAPATA